METCEFDYGLPDGLCDNDAVLWGKCEAHLTPRERAVCALVQAVEDEMAVWEWKSEKRLRIRRAIAAVREGK